MKFLFVAASLTCLFASSVANPLKDQIPSKESLQEIKADDLLRAEEQNQRPIIAMLSQELSKSLADAFEGANFTSYIGAAYIKYVESAGARAVPVLINQDDEYYEMIFNSTNGLLIPGGAVSLTDSGYAKAGKKLYEMALRSFDESGDSWPIWGTCLGFELLALLSNDGQRNLARCESYDQGLPLNLTDEFEGSRIGLNAPEDLMTILTEEKVTINFHHWCLTPANFSHFQLENFWSMLATGKDWEGTEFIALLESKKYPIWGSQFHPEKNAFEWTEKYKEIPHWRHAIQASAFFSEYFVDQTRASMHRFPDRETEEKNLIYSYEPVYTGKMEIDYVMQQVYLF